MASSMQIIDKVVRVSTDDTELVMIQTRAEAYMKIALYQTELEMGVKIIEYMPQILKDEKVRRELGIPEFDEIIIRPGRHPAREADITLIKGKKPVMRFSVKFSPSGRIRYCLQSWKYERVDADLLALIPVRSIQKGKSFYYIAIIYIPRILRIYPIKKLGDLVGKLLDEKRKVEGIEMLWTINIKEIASALRDYEIINLQNEILKKQDEMLKKQDETIDVLRRILKVLEESRKS